MVTGRPKTAGRLNMRLTKDDQQAVAAIRQHLRITKKWVTRTAVLRHALHEAARTLPKIEANPPTSPEAR